MYEDESVQSYREEILEYRAAIFWPLLRTWVKIFCSILSHLTYYTEWPIQVARRYFLSISTYLEIPLLLPGAIVGFAIACFTGALALTILTIKTVWVFRKIGPSVVEALALRLWREAHQSFVGLLKNLTAYLWTLTIRAIKLGKFYKDSISPPPEPAETNGMGDSYASSDAALNGQEDGILKTDFESLGGWKISEHLPEPDVSIGHNEGLFMAMPQGRRHRRTGTGSSLRLSGASSPQLIRTPLQMSNDGKDRRRQRGSGSGASSPESYFRKTARIDANSSGSVLESNKHSRSGSSSTSSVRSVGKRSA